MSDNIDSIIERVKKLLSLSKSDNANEAAIAAAKANQLIDAYRLSTADLETTQEVIEPVEEDQGYIYETGRLNPWKSRLVSILVNHYGLAHWNDTSYSTGRKVTRLRLVGRRSDMEIAKYMFAYLTSECQRLSDKEAKGKGHIYVNSYCIGFVNGISTQLKSSRVEAQKEASSSAIIKIDARSEEAKKLMCQLHSLKFSKSSSSSFLDPNAFQAGKSKGEAMHLGASLGTGSVKLLSR